MHPSLIKNLSTYTLRSAIFIFLLLLPILANGQNQDSISKAKKYDLLPAISFSPETGLTFGIIGYRYLDLSNNDEQTILSFINFVAVYTTKKQTLIESNWDLFTNGNQYRMRGFMGYNRFPDRNYGLGNDGSVLVEEFDLNNGVAENIETFNYLRYTIDRFTFKPVFLKKLKQNFYGGIQFDLEHQWKFEVLPANFFILNQANEVQLIQNYIPGFRAGSGLSFLYDSRDNIINPRQGIFTNLSMLFYGKYLGSDFTYQSLRLDVRGYLNPVSNQTWAFRVNQMLSFTSDALITPRGLARVGGNDFIRGYFRGSYQDNHLTAFETEYRLPFWKDDVDAPLYKFWKRLGLVAFISGAQVYGDYGNFGFDEFNLAVGTGLRILFNPQSRLNIRIDYAVGLSKDSNGPGSRQTGLYFFLAEAF